MPAFVDCPCGVIHPRGCRGHVHECTVCEWSGGNHESRPCGKCGGEVRSRPCGRAPRKGTKHCDAHGSGSPQSKDKAKRETVKAAAEKVVETEVRRRMGGTLEIGHNEAALGLLHQTAANVEVLRWLVGQLEPGTVDEGTVDYDEDGNEYTIPVTGLGGTLAIKAGSTTKENEALAHIWWTMYSQERDRLAHYAKLCHDMGIDERRLAIIDADAQRVTATLRSLEAGLLLVVVGVLDAMSIDKGPVVKAWRESLPNVFMRAIESGGGAT